MTPPSSPALHRRRNWPLLGGLACMGVLVIGLCAAGGSLIAQKVDLPQASSALPEVARQYQATGLPWTADQLMQPVPPGQNAAPLLRAAFKLADWDKYDTATKDLATDLNSGKVDEAARLLKPYSRSLAMASMATALPKLDYGRDWVAGPMLYFPELARSKAIAKAFTFRARLEAAHHQAHLAAQDLLFARRFGGLVGQEPMLIPLLVQVAIEAIVDRGAQECAASLHSDASGLRELESAMQAPIREADFRFAMRGEAFLDVTSCRNLDLIGGIDALKGDLEPGTQPPVDLNKLRRDGFPPGMSNRAFMTGTLRCWIRMARVLNDPKANAMQVGKEADAVSDALNKDPKASEILALILFPIFSQAGAAVVRVQSDDRTSLALVEALEIKARTGRFPASIEQIPGNWIDPFNGKGLHLKLTENGIRVYGVGPDLIDHGGIDHRDFPKAPSTTVGYDVVAAYPPIETKTTR